MFGNQQFPSLKITIFLGVTFSPHLYYNDSNSRKGIHYYMCRHGGGKEFDMELIPINESKLKIMLDENDMKELNICDDADCACTETRHAIRTILDRAKTEIGFNTDGSEIFVQLYTSRGGGCELFVTKSAVLSTVASDDTSGDKKPRKKEIQAKKSQGDDCRALSPRQGSLPDQRRTAYGKMIFSFDSLRDICAVCKILQNKNTDITSRAFIGSSDEYYLLLENTNMSAYSRLDALTFILEYGKRERADHLSTYLCEHGRVICSESAIETLSEF